MRSFVGVATGASLRGSPFFIQNPGIGVNTLIQASRWTWSSAARTVMYSGLRTSLDVRFQTVFSFTKPWAAR